MARTTSDPGAGPFVDAAYAAARSRPVPPARSIARSFPQDDEGERVLLAVAEGVGDPASAEAQAAEALGHLEASVSRARPGVPAGEALTEALRAADDAVARLRRVPGSVPGAGAAIVAALVDAGTATLSALGTGAVFLLREGDVSRVAGNEPARRPHPGEGLLGSGAAANAVQSTTLALRCGDTILLCSDGVVRGLGERVIQAVVEEFGVAEAAQELADLAAEQAGTAAGAVALYHLPGTAPAAPPVAAPPASASALGEVPAAPVPLEATSGRRQPDVLLWGLIGAAVLIGAAGTLAAVLAFAGGGSKAKPPATSAASATRPVAPAAFVLTPLPSASPARTAPPALPRTATPGIAATSALASATPLRASPTPLTLASLAPCDPTGAAPCRYTAQPGDSVSVIGDRFNLTRACFEAANSNHTPVAPTAANDDRIGAGEDYIIPDAAGCAALASGAATPVPASSQTPAAAATPKPTCTPKPGASAPNPLC